MKGWPDVLEIFVMSAAVVLCLLIVSDCEKHRIDHSWEHFDNKPVISK